MLGTPIVSSLGSTGGGASGWTVQTLATGDLLSFEVKGGGTSSVRWVGSVETAEAGFLAAAP